MDEPVPTGPSSPGAATPPDGGQAIGSSRPADAAAYVVPGYSAGPSASAVAAPGKGGRTRLVVVVVVIALLLGTLGACAVAWRFAQFGDVIPSGDTVALIHIDGVIAGTGSSLEGIVSPEAFLDALDAAESDSSVKAIILRIDSPGGTVAASQEIAMEVARAEKPIVASIGDVGASGAYMVASQCDEIVAVPTSAIGSIGVITEIPNVAGLLEKLGIEFTVLTAGEYKNAGSPYRSLTATETELIQREVDVAYDEFIRVVAEGRDLSEGDVREMATGWAWSALEAQDMGLVDTLGTFEDALDIAAELGGIEGTPDIVTFDEEDYGDILSGLLDVRRALQDLASMGSRTGGFRPSVPR